MRLSFAIKRMPFPAYIRTSSDCSLPSRTSSREQSIQSIHVTGLREKRLYALFGWLAVLSIFALLLLVINIMLIISLQMNQHGMKFLKFHSISNSATGDIEKVVQFYGNNIDLGTVVTNGHVGGYKDQDLDIYGSRVLIRGEENGTQLIIQDSGCRLENTKNFQIISTTTGRPIFSAHYPMLSIDNRIKKLSAYKIITNKLRSPIDENLKVSVENMSIRGNEGIRMDANTVKIIGSTELVLNTSRDGAIHINGKTRLGTASRGLPMSPSPALIASIDAFRVCVCVGSKPKLFLTPGNKPCMASQTICP